MTDLYILVQLIAVSLQYITICALTQVKFLVKFYEPINLFMILIIVLLIISLGHPITKDFN